MIIGDSVVNRVLVHLYSRRTAAVCYYMKVLSDVIHALEWVSDTRLA